MDIELHAQKEVKRIGILRKKNHQNILFNQVITAFGHVSYLYFLKLEKQGCGSPLF